MLDHTRLIDRLAERLKTDVGTAGAEIQHLLESVHRDIQERGQAHIDGLGSFSMHQGVMRFLPDPSLARDVNFRYEGLGAVELAGTAPGGDDVDESETPWPESTVFVIDEPLEELSEAGIPDFDEEIEEEAVAAVAIPAPPVEEPSAPLAPPTPVPKPPQRRVEIRLPGRYTERPKYGRRIALVASLILLALLLGAGFAWLGGHLDRYGVPSVAEVFPGLYPGDKAILLEETVPVPQAPAPVLHDSLRAAQPDSSAAALPDSAQTPPPGDSLRSEITASVPPASSGFGLAGTFDTTLATFHTIVSGTFFTQSSANEALGEASAKGWRTRLNRVSVQGQPAWELHIGQFETRVDGRDANETLDRKFQSEVIRQYGRQ